MVGTSYHAFSRWYSSEINPGNISTYPDGEEGNQVSDSSPYSPKQRIVRVPLSSK